MQFYVTYSSKTVVLNLSDFSCETDLLEHLEGIKEFSKFEESFEWDELTFQAVDISEFEEYGLNLFYNSEDKTLEPYALEYLQEVYYLKDFDAEMFEAYYTVSRYASLKHWESILKESKDNFISEFRTDDKGNINHAILGQYLCDNGFHNLEITSGFESCIDWDKVGYILTKDYGLLDHNGYLFKTS